MAELCPHCEGEMDDFGGLHLNSCPLADSSLKPPEHQAEGREKQLEEALRDCIQFAGEGWDYASPYFREKWDCDGELAKFRTALEGDER